MDLICVPSSGRAKRQQTLAALQACGITKSYRVAVVVYQDEVDDYNKMAFKGKRIKDVEVIAVPANYEGISRKRQFILTRLARQLGVRDVMVLDDDLSFCYRPDIDSVDMPYINSDKDKMHHMIEKLSRWLEKGFVHVALISRQANRQTGIKWLEPSRAMNAHAFDTYRLRKLWRKGKIEFGRVKLMEDFDLTLQLLRLGYPNRVSCQYAWTTVSNLKGGCSEYRTEKMQRRAAERLAELHHPFVSLVTRKAKTWKGLTERIDVRCSWKKAYAAGRSARDKRAATNKTKVAIKRVRISAHQGA